MDFYPYRNRFQTYQRFEPRGRGRGRQDILDELRTSAIYARAGAAWDASRVRGRLRALGVRRRIASSERTGTGWEALTDAELRVVELAADGKTNREIATGLFVSPHTVNTHLRHVFDKLDIKSRVELTRIAESRLRQPLKTSTA